MLTLKQLIKSGFTTRQAKVLQGLGSGTSGVPSATHIGRVNSPHFTFTAGESFTVSFTGGLVRTAPYGSALPLAVSVNDDGHIVLPDEDATYDVIAAATLQCNVADVGKMVGIEYSGNDGNEVNWVPVQANGTAQLFVNVPDRVFPGDGTPYVPIRVRAEFLTEDGASFGSGDGMYVIIYKR